MQGTLIACDFPNCKAVDRLEGTLPRGWGKMFLYDDLWSRVEKVLCPEHFVALQGMFSLPAVGQSAKAGKTLSAGQETQITKRGK